MSDKFRAKYIQLPNPTSVHRVIAGNPKFFPYFADCLGTIDGSHLDARPPALRRFPYRDRNGNQSQNVLAACDWDMIFLFILTGWEGSAADGYLFEEAITHGLNIPEGKFYVADAGFPLCDKLLVPYRNVRYHLREWEAAAIRYVL